MTDETPEPTEEDLLVQEAKRLVAAPPDPIPDAADLPDDVRTGIIED